MDDDDYYPPERVSHAVEMLQSHPKALCAGASEIYIYFHEMEKFISLDHILKHTVQLEHSHSNANC